MRLRGALYVALAATLWGLWTLFLRPAGLPGATGSALVMSVLAVAGIPAQWRQRHRSRSRAAWLWMVAFGVIDAGNMGFYFSALARGSVAAAVLSHYLAPTLVPLFAWLLLRERPSARTWPAVVAGLVGLFLLLRPGRSGVVSMAALLGGTSALFYGAMIPVAKRLIRDFTPMEIQSYHAYLSAALLFAWAPPLNAPMASLSLVLGGALLCGVLAGWMFFLGLARIRAAEASALTYLEPLTATVVGSLAFGQSLAPTAALGAALVILSGILALRAPRPSSARDLAAG
jgi:DME family drug/metabolite transporter